MPLFRDSFWSSPAIFETGTCWIILSVAFSTCGNLFFRSGSARCVAAEPTHGELWTSISKMTKNRRLEKSAILKEVVAAYFAEGAIAVLAGAPASSDSGANEGGSARNRS